MGKPDRAYELEARSTDLDPFRGSPYRPAASDSAALKGLTEDCIRSHANWGKSYLHYGRQPQKTLVEGGRMTLKIMPAAIELLREHIEKSPLEPDELRRVKGLGNIFIARSKIPHEDEGDVERDGWTYWSMYVLKIDGEVYYIYYGIPTDRA